MPTRRLDGGMPITLQHATPAALDEVARAVADWQQDGIPVQLHPGDLGWSWRWGADGAGPDRARVAA